MLRGLIELTSPLALFAAAFVGIGGQAAGVSALTILLPTLVLLVSSAAFAKTALHLLSEPIAVSQTWVASGVTLARSWLQLANLAFFAVLTVALLAYLHARVDGFDLLLILVATLLSMTRPILNRLHRLAWLGVTHSGVTTFLTGYLGASLLIATPWLWQMTILALSLGSARAGIEVADRWPNLSSRFSAMFLTIALLFAPLCTVTLVLLDQLPALCLALLVTIPIAMRISLKAEHSVSDHNNRQSTEVISRQLLSESAAVYYLYLLVLAFAGTF